MPVDQDGLCSIAAECVALVTTEYGLTLDWHPDSLQILDDVCQRLLASPMSSERVDLWWKLVGAYTGEVILATYGGQWITHDQAPGSYTVLVNGVTGFPFAVAGRILGGEPFKSLASFGRAFPHVAGNATH